MDLRSNPAHDFLAGVDAATPLIESGDRTLSLNAEALPWRAMPSDGTEIKLLRADPVTRRSFAILRMAAGAKAGLHTHTAVTSTYFLDGELVDYLGCFGAGIVGVNEPGATHDALTPVETTFLVRNDGPVYPVPLLDEFRGPDRDDGLAPINTALIGPPDITVQTAMLPWTPTGIAGVQRRTIFSPGPNRSIAMLRLDAGATVPGHRHWLACDAYVLEGALEDDDGVYEMGAYFLVPSGTRRRIRSREGCTLIAWSDGPVAYDDGTFCDLYASRAEWPAAVAA